MIENLKKITLQVVVFLVNLSLVGGGVAYFKNQQEKKQAADDLADETSGAAAAIAIPVAEKAAQLQRVIEKVSLEKKSNTAKSDGYVTVQKPKTVTRTVPGGVVTKSSGSGPSSSNAGSSASSSVKVSTPAPAPEPAKTTSKS